MAAKKKKPTKPVKHVKRAARAQPAKRKQPAKRAKAAKAATPTKVNKPMASDEPVAAELAEEIATQAQHAMAMLFPEAKKPPTPKAIAAAILEYVDAIHDGKVLLPSRQVAERCLALACLWGEAVRKELGYEWAQVRWQGGGSIGIVEPERRFALYPFPYIRRIVEDRHADNTILLLFNMLVAGNVPKAAPRAYVTLG